MEITQLLAEVAGPANDLTWTGIVQIVGMVLIGAIGSLIRMKMTDVQKSIDGLSSRMDRQCTRLRDVELDVAGQSGRKVRRLRNDVDDTAYEDNQ